MNWTIIIDLPAKAIEICNAIKNWFLGAGFKVKVLIGLPFD